MVLDVAQFIVIDNHAHSLVRDHLELDELGFRRCFTESRSVSLIENHLPHSAHYMDLLDHLERIFNTRSEREFLNFRSRQDPLTFVRMLWDDVSIGALIIDDGFRSDNSLTLNELAEVSGRPVYECRRIETIIEHCLQSDDISFEETLASFCEQLLQPGSAKLVALKTICGYRGGLSLDVVDRTDASLDFQRIKQQPAARKRIERSAFYHYLLMQAFELAGQHDLPVQIHCGIGDDDADLLQCNPALMQHVFRLRNLSRTKFVLLHCFPFVREAAFMASLYSNVFIDLSLSVSLASPASAGMLTDALSIAPATKILAGSDGHSCPEAHWYGVLSWKRGLTRALFDMINQSSVTHREAEQIAAFILHDNAMRLYNLEGLS